jgi:hypothetical protein
MGSKEVIAALSHHHTAWAVFSDCKVWSDDGGFSVLAMLDDLNTVKYWSTIIQSHDDLALHIGLKFFQDLFIPARLVCKKF